MKKFKITFNAPVILSLVLISFAVTVIGELTKNASTILLFSVRSGSLINPLTYIRLFTHVVGHFGFEHFIGNATYLLLIGPMLEEKYGSKTMLKLILITAPVTGLIHSVMWTNTSLCGASGVVFACIMLSSFTAFKEGEIPLSFILVLCLFIGKEVWSIFFVRDRVANFVHILGGGVGAVLGYALNRKSK